MLPRPQPHAQHVGEFGLQRADFGAGLHSPDRRTASCSAYVQDCPARADKGLHVRGIHNCRWTAANAVAKKAGRRNAYHRQRLSLHVKRGADNCGIAAVFRLPRLIAQDGDRRRALLVVGRRLAASRNTVQCRTCRNNCRRRYSLCSDFAGSEPLRTVMVLLPACIAANFRTPACCRAIAGTGRRRRGRNRRRHS